MAKKIAKNYNIPIDVDTIEIAKKLLERNMTIKEIAEITKLTEEEIQKLDS